MTEWPSIVPEEDYIMQPGLVLAVEPNLALPGGTLVHEEDVLITENGPEWLSRRSSSPGMLNFL